MGASLATFTTQFPEFDGVDEDYLSAMLAAALLEIDADVWLAKADQGQMYLAAHKLALSPFGNNAKLVPTKSLGPGPHGQTSYGAHYDALVMQVSSGFRVT